LEKKKSAH